MCKPRQNHVQLMSKLESQTGKVKKNPDLPCKEKRLKVGGSILNDFG